MKRTLFAVMSLLFSVTALAAEPSASRLDLTSSTVGYAAIVIFILAYLLVMGEEKLHMRKSKPVLVAAGIIWILIGFVYTGDNAVLAEEAFRENLLKFAELMLFLLVAMTYINALKNAVCLMCSVRGY
jgi:membrane-bound ClpP family serine protease